MNWKNILMTIGRGFISRSGTAIFKQLFESGVDFRKLMEHMLNDIDRIIAHRLEKEFLQQMFDLAEVVNEMLCMYVNSPSDLRLTFIEQNSLLLTVRFKRYGVRTYKEYLLANTQILFALEEKIKRGDNNEIKNLINKIDDAEKHVTQMNNGHILGKTSYYERFKVIRKEVSFTQMVEYWVDKDGTRISEKFSAKRGSKHEREVIERIYNYELKEARKIWYNRYILEPYIYPGQEILNLWKKRRKDLKKLIEN